MDESVEDEAGERGEAGEAPGAVPGEEALPSRDASARFDGLFASMGRNADVLVGALGFGLCRGCGDWATMLANLADFDGALGAHEVIDAGKLAGLALFVLIAYRFDRGHSSAALLAAPSLLLAAGCIELWLGVWSGLGAASSLGAVMAGVGWAALQLQWLEYCGRIPPRKTVLVISAAYLVNYAFDLLAMGTAAPQALVVVAALAGLSFLALAYAYSALSDRDGWVREYRFGDRAYRPLYPLLLILVFAFAYGVGDSATSLGHSTLVARLGGALPAALFIAGICVYRLRIDLGGLFMASLAFMVGGLAIVPFNESLASQAQLLMSASIASCYILCYTIACMPAYRDGTSSAASCAAVRVIVIAASQAGAAVGSLMDADGMFVVITATIALLVGIAAAGLGRGQRYNPLFLPAREAGQGSAGAGSRAAGGGRLHGVVRARGLSEREEAVLGLIARGRSSKDVAEELFITQSGVRAHLTRIYRKFDVHSREELLDVLEKEGVRCERGE